MRIDYRKLLTEKIRTSPIPVFVQSLRKYKKFLKARKDKDDYSSICGELVLNNKKLLAGYPKDFIWIDAKMSISQQLTTLVHELAHVEYHKNRAKTGSVLSELNSYSKELEYCLRLKSKFLVKILVNTIIDCAKNGYLNNSQACEILLQSNLYAKAILFINKR